MNQDSRFQVKGTEFADFLGHVVDDVSDLVSFGSGDPFESHPFIFDSHRAQEDLQQREAP